MIRLDFNKALLLIFLLPLASAHAETGRSIPASQTNAQNAQSSVSISQSTSNASFLRRSDSDDNKPMDQDDYD